MALIANSKSNNFGGSRPGAGRKAGGQNADMQDRKVVCMWFCDWFARQLKAQKGRRAVVTDSECEESVNRCFQFSKPVFASEKVRLGGMWRKARVGTRPFSPERLSSVATAAEKLGFWSQAWRDTRGLGPYAQKQDLFVLAMIAVDGFTDQRQAKQQFKTLHTKLTKQLKRLNECVDPLNFDKVKAVALKAFVEFVDFKEQLSPTAGHVVLRYDLEASFQDFENDYRYYQLKPAQALKWLELLQFGRGAERLKRLAWQVWACDFSTNFKFDISSAKKHIRKTKTGTNLAQ